MSFTTAHSYQPVCVMDDVDRLTTPSLVLLGGRIVWSRDAFSVTMTLAGMITAITLFHVETSDYTWHHISPAVVLLSVYMEILAFASLWRCNATDPGIIPRGKAGEVEGLNDTPVDGELVKVNGMPMRLKYCNTCRIIRPPRCSHCSVCDNCIDGFDHHCPWMGNCIGVGNYRYFYSFLLSASINCLIMLVISIVRMVRLSHGGGFSGALEDNPKSVAVVVITFFGFWMTGGMACMHTTMLATNITTNESIKHGPAYRSAFTTGSLIKDCTFGLFGPRLPSRFKLYSVRPQELHEVEDV